MSTKSPDRSAPKSAERSVQISDESSPETTHEETTVDEIPEPSGNNCDCGEMANAREELETILKSKDEEYKKYFPNNLKIGINEVIERFDLTKEQKKKLLINPYRNKGQHSDTRENDSLMCLGMKYDKINFLKSVINNGERYAIDIKKGPQNFYLLQCAIYSDIDEEYVIFASHTPFQCANYLLTEGAKLNKDHSDALITVLENRKKTSTNQPDHTYINQRYNDVIVKLQEKISSHKAGGKRNTTKRSNSKRKTKRHFKKAKSRKYRI